MFIWNIFIVIAKAFYKNIFRLKTINLLVLVVVFFKLLKNAGKLYKNITTTTFFT